MSTDKRNFDFDINTSNDLNKMLTGVLMQVRRGEINHETVKSITLVADKINKNNVNQLEYKKICKHEKELSFFDE
tara:strand:- start:118 stop:342 length:225 start_codon:yes stop_codon:yes gene_type:complete